MLSLHTHTCVAQCFWLIPFDSALLSSLLSSPLPSSSPLLPSSLPPPLHPPSSILLLPEQGILCRKKPLPPGPPPPAGAPVVPRGMYIVPLVCPSYIAPDHGREGGKKRGGEEEEGGGGGDGRELRGGVRSGAPC
eukprot:1534213-Rhodomonas_salina.1